MHRTDLCDYLYHYVFARVKYKQTLANNLFRVMAVETKIFLFNIRDDA